MIFLALESSAKAASAALCRDEFLLAESYQNSGLTHSRTLLPLVQELLGRCEMPLSEVDLIAVAHGPGSFTGLRIGLAAAKGLAWPEEKPCLGVSTLEAMAWNLCGVEGVVCCAMDARRSQVYNALFTMSPQGPRRLCEDRAISLEQLRQDPHFPGALVVGDGAELCLRSAPDLELRLAPPNLRFQHAYGVARCALEHHRRGERCDGAGLEAHYLRLSQAERERLEREARARSGGV